MHTHCARGSGIKAAMRKTNPSRRALPALAAAVAALLALAGCGRGDESELAEIDNQLIGNDTDPALTSALEDQILVDPALVQQSNPNSVRPPETPVQAQYPLGAAPDEQRRAAAGREPPRRPPTERRTEAARSGEAGEPRAAVGASAAACGANFQYGPEWAQRLPAAFSLYPGARLDEAAGVDRGDCHMRVVTFTTADRPRQVLDWYRRIAERGGYSAEHQTRGGDQVLGGVNQGADGAFYLIVTPRRSGSDVALIVNTGR